MPGRWLNEAMRLRRSIVLGAICLLGALPTAVADAHDEIESSVPEHRAQFDDPISEVVINFGEPVGNVELALVGPDDRDLPGTVVKVSDTTARLEFDPLEREGEYLVRYLAEEDGHLVAGAITFVYGSRSGTGAGATTWILFGAAAVLILGAGTALTVRRARIGDDADADDVADPVSA